MKTATMLYKCPGPHDIHGGHFDYTIVDADQDGAVDAALADGWTLTTPEAVALRDKALADAKTAQEAEAERLAQAALADDSKPPTRAELEQMATSLGLPFNKQSTDKKLAKLIEAASAADKDPAAPAAGSETPPTP